MREIPVGRRGDVARVDDADYLLVVGYSWFRREDHRMVYAVRYWRDAAGHKHSQRMHTLITGWGKVDHEDHDGLNNQRYNLRPVTDAQNGANRRPDLVGTSRFKGVYWHRTNRRWCAHIRNDGIWTWLGSHHTEEDAARAYDRAAVELFGEYAFLNLPPD
jgi:hypothetical protein